MSKPPLTASSGTFGSGPGPKTPPPAGVGQRRQKSAFPKRAAHLPNGPNDPAGERVDRRLVHRRPAPDRSVGGPRGAGCRGRPWPRTGRCSRLFGRGGVRHVVKPREPEQRLGVPAPRRVDRGRELRGDAGIEVGVEHRREQLDPVDPLRHGPAVELQHLAGDRLRGVGVGERGDVGGEVGRRRAASRVGAEGVQLGRHLAEDVRAVGIRQLRRQHLVEPGGARRARGAPARTRVRASCRTRRRRARSCRRRGKPAPRPGPPRARRCCRSRGPGRSSLRSRPPRAAAGRR